MARVENLFRFKCVIVIILMIAVELAGGLLVYFNGRQIVRKNIDESYVLNIAAYSARFETLISQKHESVFAQSDLPESYTVFDVDENNNFTYLGEQYAVPQANRLNMERSKFNFYTLTEMTSGILNDERLFIVFSKVENGAVKAILQSSDDFYAELKEYGYTKETVARTGDAKIVFSSDSGLSGKINALAGRNILGRDSEENYVMNARIGGTDYLLSLSRLGDSGEYYAVCFTDASAVSANYRNENAVLIVTVAACFLVFVGLTAALLKLTFNSQTAPVNSNFSYTLKDRGEENEEVPETVEKVEYKNINDYNQALMREEYEQLYLTTKNVLIGVIEITNIFSFEQLFDRKFAQDVYYNLYKKVEKAYGKAYSVSPSKIGVILTPHEVIKEMEKDVNLLLDILRRPISVVNDIIKPQCKGGFAYMDATSPDSGFEYAMTCAEAGCSRSKESKTVHCYLYLHSQNALYKKYFSKQYDIRKMLRDECFAMEFQPQCDTVTGKVVGFEALFRTKRALSFDINVFEFIKQAERTGFMIPLGEFIYRDAMEFAKSIEGSGVKVSLNISPVQMLQVGFAENLLKIYRSFSLKPNSICVEITESFLMTDFEENVEKLRILRENGIDVHLDDFGSAYSSLFYLKKLPVDVLKIDRDLIADIDTDEYSKTIASFIINVAKYLDLKCIAEGIETEKEREVLKKLGCDYIQGFLIGKSMSPQEARRMVYGDGNNE